MNHEIIAEIRDLSVVYHTEEDDVHALNGVSLKLYKGETLGLGRRDRCGQDNHGALHHAAAAQAASARSTSGEIYLEGRDLLQMHGSGYACDPRRGDFHDLSGPDDQPESGPQGGRADR